MSDSLIKRTPLPGEINVSPSEFSEPLTQVEETRVRVSGLIQYMYVHVYTYVHVVSTYNKLYTCIHV